MGYESEIQFTLDTICPWYGDTGNSQRNNDSADC